MMHYDQADAILLGPGYVKAAKDRPGLVQADLMGTINLANDNPRHDQDLDKRLDRKA